MQALSELINKSGLKVTPQRLAILDAIISLHNHPTAENICDYIKTSHPNIAIGTVYNVLETFVEKGIIEKVVTANDVMRYDFVSEKHHHLYCSESNKIEDFYDDELTNLINNYFTKKDIPNFKVKDIKLQIIGNFDN